MAAVRRLPPTEPIVVIEERPDGEEVKWTFFMHDPSLKEMRVILDPEQTSAQRMDNAYDVMVTKVTRGSKKAAKEGVPFRVIEECLSATGLFRMEGEDDPDEEDGEARGD